MSPRPDPIDSLAPADKFLRLGVVASFALLLLLVTVRSFMDGPDPSELRQIAEASDAPAAAEAPSDDMDVAQAPTEPEPAAQEVALEEEASVADEGSASDTAATETDLAEASVEQTEVAEPAAEATAATNWLESSALLASADIDAGESAFRQCSTCHQYASERNAGGASLGRHRGA